MDLDYRLWKILVWIDNNINHTFVDWVFNHFSTENSDGSDHISYKIWDNIFRRFCHWVILDFGDKIHDKYGGKYNLE